MLAQYDDTNNIYFQYNNGNPFGFVLNGVQYLYITNLNGDVVGITDIDGNLIAEYTYDEWGRLLSITTAEEDNAEQLSIAEINPLRYRGYYYDNETGYYYLQSRYYDPELCRFISADSFDYIDTNTPISINAYAYCINNPLIYIDPTGFYVIAESEKTDNWFEAVLKGLSIGIIVNEITIEFEATIKTVNRNFNFNNWYSSLSKSTKGILMDIGVLLSTLINTLWVENKEYAEAFFGKFSLNTIVKWLINDTGASLVVDGIVTLTSIGKDKDSGKFTIGQAFTSGLINSIVSLVSNLVPMGFWAKVGINALDFVANFLFNGFANYQNGHFWGFNYEKCN